MNDVTLAALTPDDREQFILDNQEAFNYGALEEFGRRDDHFEEDGEIISRETIEQSIDGGEAYRILLDGKKVGGVVISVDGSRGDLELLFVSPKLHSNGVGYAAWCAVEKLHPEVKIWETCTPYFETRNIHFYVNRCGFHIVEFFNSRHPDPNDPDPAEALNDQFPDGMFRFEKRMEPAEKAYAFDAVLHEAGSGAYVVFPYDIKKEFGKGRIKVHAEFNGEPYDGSIVNMGVRDESGSICYVIGVLKAIRKKLGIADGDTVHVKITAR